ncbi:MAG: hypothetical protein HYR66_02920 [Sphingobacteriales bacterium]|nr:hypothetical protein [Sphingobacteriales bacterium]MBI3718116.1 hypothetical protein [Sphingobacteriales bacterium]
MRQNIFSLVAVFILFTFLVSSNCNRDPYLLPYDNIGGFVIGKETCNTDDTQDYWLLDFTVYPNTPHVGDTLILNGTTYTNVLKVKGLATGLKQIGMRVSIDYKTITSNKVITTGCTITSPVTYPLRELFSINQFEIR